MARGSGRTFTSGLSAFADPISRLRARRGAGRASAPQQIVAAQLIPGVTVTGTAGNDTLFGGVDDDTLLGLDGQDTLVGGPGADVLDGGQTLDTDFASYANATAGVTVNLGVVDFSVNDTHNFAFGTGDAAGDVFISIEGLIGSGFGDLITETGGIRDTIYGGAGNDQIDANPSLGTGTGTDNSGAISETLYGGAGFDHANYSTTGIGITLALDGTFGVGGFASGDRLFEIERLTGSQANDVLGGSVNDDTLDGFSGNDTLQGGAGADSLDGGIGIDFASYAAAGAGVIANLVTGGTAGDALGDTFNEVEGLIGSAFDDVLIGDTAANSLIGGVGSDTLEGGAGADRLDGGVGTDFASYAAAGVAVIANLANASAGTNDAFGDIFIGVEGLIGSAFNDVLIGDGNANTLIGNGGNDTLDGGAMDDALFGDDGDDRLIDTIGSDSIFGGNDNDTVQFSSTSFQLSGGGGSDPGDAGTDTLLGTAGNDSIDLGLARFSLFGGGNTVTADTDGGRFEVFDLGAGDDRLFFSTGSVNNLFSTVFGGAGNDLIAMIDGGTTQRSSHTLFGGEGGDQIWAGWFGFGGNATVFGGAGDDFIYSGASPAPPSSLDGLVITGFFDDTLYGGAGDDTYYWSPNNGGFGTDVISDSESGPRGNGLVIFGGNTAPFSGFPDTGNLDNLATGQVIFSDLGLGVFKIENKDDSTDSITFQGGDITIINLQSRPGGLGTGENFIYTWDPVNGVFVDQNG